MSGHLRGIVIAGALAALALGLGFMTLSMNRTAAAPAATHRILPLKVRRALAKKAAAVKATPKAKTTTKALAPKAVAPKAVAPKAVAPKTVAPKATPKPKVKPKPRVNPNFLAAKNAGLPVPIAHALASRPVVVIALSSKDDALAQLSAAEARTGAALAGAAFRLVNVDRDGGAVEVLTRLLGSLPSSPATFVYTRPATLVTTLTGFSDRTVVQQAAASAAPSR